MKTFPKANVWRGSVKDKQTSTIRDKLWWDAMVRVDQGPHKDLKFVDAKIRGRLADDDNCLSPMAFLTEIIFRYCVLVGTNIICTDPDRLGVRKS